MIKNRFRRQSTSAMDFFNQIRNEQKMYRKIRRYTCKIPNSGMQIFYCISVLFFALMRILWVILILILVNSDSEITMTKEGYPDPLLMQSFVLFTAVHTCTFKWQIINTVNSLCTLRNAQSVADLWSFNLIFLSLQLHVHNISFNRVQAGHCFHLFTSLQYEEMKEYIAPEILRTRLEELCLMIKVAAIHFK